VLFVGLILLLLVPAVGGMRSWPRTR